MFIEFTNNTEELRFHCSENVMIKTIKNHQQKSYTDLDKSKLLLTITLLVIHLQQGSQKSNTTKEQDF